MRVTAYLYVPPGRGMYQRQEMQLPDENMPKTTHEFAARSYNAVRHFWPDAAIAKAVFVERNTEAGRRYSVEGDRWQVVWASDEHAAASDEAHKKLMSGEAGSLLRMASIHTPQERREL